MNMGKVTESELFRKVNILMLDRDKEKLEDIKTKLTLQSNMEIDNSALVRSAIRYFYENPDMVKELVPYVEEAKGFTVLEQFIDMVHEKRSVHEIKDKLGISFELVKNLKSKQESFEKEQKKSGKS